MLLLQISVLGLMSLLVLGHGRHFIICVVYVQRLMRNVFISFNETLLLLHLHHLDLLVLLQFNGMDRLGRQLRHHLLLLKQRQIRSLLLLLKRLLLNLRRTLLQLIVLATEWLSLILWSPCRRTAYLCFWNQVLIWSLALQSLWVILELALIHSASGCQRLLD